MQEELRCVVRQSFDEPWFFLQRHRREDDWTRGGEKKDHARQAGCSESRIEIGSEFAAVDAVLEHVPDECRIAGGSLAHDGHHGRIAFLPDPKEHADRRRFRERVLHPGNDERLKPNTGRTVAMNGLLEQFVNVRRGVFENRAAKTGFVAVIVVDQLAVDASTRCDLPNARGVKALLRKEHPCG